METERLHVYIEGAVQGVGFRYATQARAQSLGLDGWVRNLPDGRVEAEFEGVRPLLDRMLEWCRQGPPHAAVCRVDSSFEAGLSRHNGFRLRW